MECDAGVGDAHDGVDIDLPAVYILEHHHVRDALARASRNTVGSEGLTLWIHSATVGIADRFFSSNRYPQAWHGRAFYPLESDSESDGDVKPNRRVRRILVRPEPATPHPSTGPSASAVLLGALVRRIGEYEADLVDIIHSFASHKVDKIHHVGSEAFNGCTGLTEVVLPNTLTHIGSGAFDGCTGLTKVTLPNTLTHIGNGAFRKCCRLTNVTLPNTITHIGDWAFHACFGLTEVTLPNTLSRLGVATFYGCTGLTEVILPNTLTRIGNAAFAECPRLTELTLPNTLTHIGSCAFRECSELTQVTLPNTLVYIGNRAFAECTELSQTDMPH